MAELGKAITVGSLLVLAIGVIVVLAILPEIASKQTLMTSKLDYVNESSGTLSGTVTGVGECFAVGVAREVNTSSPNCNKTLSLTPAVTDWQRTNCPLSDLVVKLTNGTQLTENTDYIFYATSGIVAYQNTTLMNSTEMNQTYNVTYATYKYCDDGYISDSAGRSVAGLILIFTALALVAFAIYYSVKQYF